jgi:hypothetical protein
MPARHIHNSGYWISQASKLRALAETVSPATRANLLRMARDYDLMAVRAEERAQVERQRDTRVEPAIEYVLVPGSPTERLTWPSLNRGHAPPGC